MRRFTALGAIASIAFVALTLLAAPPALAAGGWLGVSTQSLDRDLRDALEVRGDGVLVTRVVDDSPADRAGVRKGDVIVSFNSRAVGSPDDLRDFVRDAGAGRRVAVRLSRDGRVRTIDVRLGDVDDAAERVAPPAPRAPEAPRAPRAAPAPRVHGEPHIEIWKDGERITPKGLKEWKGLEDLGDLRVFADRPELKKLMRDGRLGQMRMFSGTAGRGRLGVQVQDLNDDLADALGLDTRRGAFVLEVLDDTPASRAGLRAGDVIRSVDGREVGGGDALREALGEREGSVRLEVSRKGSRRTVEADLGSPERGGQRFEWRSDDEGGEGRDHVFRRAPEVRREIRDRTDSRGDRDDLRQELEALRQELRDLRRQLREEADREDR